MKIINFQYASKVVNKMRPILKLYRGYANEQELIVMGHVLKPTKKRITISFKKFKKTVGNRFISVKTQSNADVYLVHNNIKIHTKTLTDGYFKFCIPLEQSNDYGWIDYEVSIIYKNETIITKESYIRPVWVI
jgi:hypothetical protein